jgi:hypothetical protein
MPAYPADLNEWSTCRDYTGYSALPAMAALWQKTGSPGA